jgi:hypothetical protein
MVLNSPCHESEIRKIHHQINIKPFKKPGFTLICQEVNGVACCVAFTVNRFEVSSVFIDTILGITLSPESGFIKGFAGGSGLGDFAKENTDLPSVFIRGILQLVGVLTT